jgi:hypothetical protein
MNLRRDRGEGRATGQPQGGWTRGVLEQYVAGSDTRGRPEGRAYPRSQQPFREISGLGKMRHSGHSDGHSPKSTYPLS